MLFIELCFNNILQSGSWNSIEISIIYPSNIGMEISENQKKQAMQNARKSRNGKMKGEYLKHLSPPWPKTGSPKIPFLSDE